MDKPVTPPRAEQGPPISDVVAVQGGRLRNFIRRRVADPRDAEDILRRSSTNGRTNRLLMPIEHVTGGFSACAHRITDLFERKKAESSAMQLEAEDGELLRSKIFCPSPDAGPESLLRRACCWTSWKLALTSCPLSNAKSWSLIEIEGRSFYGFCLPESGVNVNQLLARKRYACSPTRAVQDIHDELKREIT